MKYKSLLLLCVLSLMGCGGGQSDSETIKEDQEIPPPDVTTPITKRYQVTLQWSQELLDINDRPLNDLSGFKIQYGESVEALDQVIMINDPTSRVAVIDNLTAGEYYVSVKSLTTSGLESESSVVHNVSIGQ